MTPGYHNKDHECKNKDHECANGIHVFNVITHAAESEEKGHLIISTISKASRSPNDDRSSVPLTEHAEEGRK